MKREIPPDILELWEYSFIQSIRNRRSYFLTKLVLEFGCLFIPINNSVNFRIRYSDIRKNRFQSLSLGTHIFKQVDMIHFRNKSNKSIAVIGNDIHTEDGFNPSRILNIRKTMSFSIEETKLLLSIRDVNRFSNYLNEIRVFIISGPFVLIYILSIILCRVAVWLLQ